LREGGWGWGEKVAIASAARYNRFAELCLGGWCSTRAAQELWERYYRRLVGFARRKLNPRYTGLIGDEDDVALSAFASFYRAAEQGRFPQLADSRDLWRLLIVIAQRKISRQVRRENCQKRRRGNGAIDDIVPIDVEAIASAEPTGEFCAVAIESLRELLNQLSDAPLRRVAVMKMEGYTNEEIASQLNCSLSTVERKLRRIRHEWAAVLSTNGEPAP
jgi:RNA polymerase sigma factor (sigma-70 family)